VTLQFYSSKAYEFVRKTFGNTLPHLSTIRKWFSNIEGGPGFSTVALKLLKDKAAEAQMNGKRLFVSVLLDDRSIRKEIRFESHNNRFNGFVDGFETAYENPTPANEVLVIMAVGINFHFKVPIGYFFISGLSGIERANLVKIALQKLHETEAVSISLTCDGPSAHFAMLKNLGASLDPDDMRPFFTHPSDKSIKVHVFLDVVHMFKLVRNVLASQKVIFSPSGMQIEKDEEK